MNAAPGAMASAAPCRIAVCGASGRMGRAVIAAVQAAPDLQLTGALVRQGDPVLGADATAFLGSPCGVAVTADLQAGLAGAQVLIDFTRPEGTLHHLRVCRELGVRAVVGTTGFSAAQHAEIVLHSQQLAIVLSPNMSIGVNVVLQLLAQAGALLGDDFDVEISETHHRDKVDAPSGTALKMAEVVAAARGRDLADCTSTSRAGGGERVRGSIGLSSLRGGDVVGDHTVLFAGPGERIEITHRSASRSTYAEGSLRAARFLPTRPHGLFGMGDVLAAAS